MRPPCANLGFGLRFLTLTRSQAVLRIGRLPGSVGCAGAALPCSSGCGPGAANRDCRMRNQAGGSYLCLYICIYTFIYIRIFVYIYITLTAGGCRRLSTTTTSKPRAPRPPCPRARWAQLLVQLLQLKNDLDVLGGHCRGVGVEVHSVRAKVPTRAPA